MLFARGRRSQMKRNGSATKCAASCFWDSPSHDKGEPATTRSVGALAVSAIVVALSAVILQRSVSPTDLPTSNLMTKTTQSEDPSSFANTAEARVTHFDWNVSVLFEQRVVDGSIDLTVQLASKDVKEIVLDTRNLTIHSVFLV